ncbi:2'-5' RNA ligase family protein [Hymenobacter sp. H14-R3]|uniref:2'-5' RNA ligase family protein n=1 Tax=Hymenobacter sp. H14-R3 TaxID=3046308 RepID=UPI0024B90B3F|nr:2'-5' RNA ligase family protein [Hymenobacter sp. H14-R3]MDJ0366988.1 2'-5' RNA ligase family protein [Hymenobacter sp. H14-R3]
MLAITSLLPSPSSDHINALIKSLETEFGLTDVQATPEPHLTYQIVEPADLETLKEALHEIAHTTAPFIAHTTGLGMFPGDNPVIHIPVLRSDALNLLHHRILEVAAPLCSRTDKFSAPDLWLPHISLALHDTTPELLGPVMQFLNNQTFNLELEISNLAILQPQGDMFVREVVFEFGQ